MLFIICYTQCFVGIILYSKYLYQKKIMSKEMRKYIDSFKNFILKESIEEQKDNILFPLSETGKAKTLILIPGGDGDGRLDFEVLANSLNNVSVYTTNFDNELDVREYVKNISSEINDNKNITEFSIGGFSIGGSIAWHLARELKSSNKFNNKLFFIDSGICSSTDDFINNIVSGNKPRVAIAQPLIVFEKNRKGEQLSDDEEIQIKKFYDENSLKAFKKNIDGNYIEFVGNGNYPPNTEDIKKQSKNQNLWIIEDKFEKEPFFSIRYSNKPKKMIGKTFQEGDIIDYKHFTETNTRKKIGLCMDGLEPLSGVEIISLYADSKKEGVKSSEEIKQQEENDKKATNSKNVISIPIKNVEHSNITKSPELANKIQKYIFKKF